MSQVVAGRKRRSPGEDENCKIGSSEATVDGDRQSLFAGEPPFNGG
jgi:hypothetical protein